MKILLVGNYLPDRQESMLRLADALLAGLKGAGIEVELVRPRAFFGSLPFGKRLGKWLGYVDKFLLFPFVLKRRAAHCDLVHICDHSNAHYTAYLSRIPHLVTCCDLLAIRSARGEFPENKTGATGRILQRIILRGLDRAKAITCISQATRKDLLRLTTQQAESVRVTYLGLNYPYAPAPDAHRKAPLEHPEGYLLHVGGDHWYKNRKGVLAIYQELRAQSVDPPPNLIMVGPPLEEIPDGVESRSQVGNEELCRLYSNAELLLFPSLEEGFGWPILEAQACGCRVVTTRKAPMTEVGGESAFYLDDPHDARAAARVIARALDEPSESRAKRIAEGLAHAAGFSMEKMVREYIAIYRQLCDAQ